MHIKHNHNPEADDDLHAIMFKALIEEIYHTYPVCVGLIMIHYKKSFSTYYFFASSLVGLNNNISKLVAFETDGEIAISEAFACVYPFAVHLQYTIHA
jgi:hypothetical protein